MTRQMDISELTEKLGVSKATIYAWTSQGKIPFFKVGNRLVRFREQDIAAWLDSHKSKQTVTPFHFIKKKQRPAVKKLNVADEHVNRIVEKAKRKVLA